MWRASTQSLNDRSLLMRIYDGKEAVSYGSTLMLWQHSNDFRDFFVEQLSNAPFSGFRWETPPLTVATTDRAFEYVLLRADSLDRQIDPAAFQSNFARAGAKGVAAFPNLQGDAHLVVPCPTEGLNAYGHLASFVRRAPREQVHELWQTVGRETQLRVGRNPLWLSTAGMGVPWLHVRLDSRPKYYGYQPYARQQ